MTGRVVEACLERSLLYYCQVRVWYERDMKLHQKWVDKCFSYTWIERNGELLREIKARGVNIQDVRSCVGVRSVRCIIEKRVL